MNGRGTVTGRRAQVLAILANGGGITEVARALDVSREAAGKAIRRARESANGGWSDDRAPDLPGAACAGLPDEVFFPTGRGVNESHYRDARRVCAGCPEREPCAAYAIAHPSLDGFWGGLLPDERRQIRKGARR